MHGHLNVKLAGHIFGHKIIAIVTHMQGDLYKSKPKQLALDHERRH
jgi:hypothetical protein